MAVTATGVWNCRSSSIPTDLFSSHQDFLVPLADQELKVSGFLVQKFILFTSHFCRKGEMGRRESPLWPESGSTVASSGFSRRQCNWGARDSFVQIHRVLNPRGPHSHLLPPSCTLPDTPGISRLLLEQELEGRCLSEPLRLLALPLKHPCSYSVSLA